MKKSVFGGTGGGNRLVYKGRDDYFFTYFRFYTVMISDGRNNWQKKNDCLFSELASGRIRHGGQQGYDINSIANRHNTQRRRDYTGRYVTCQHVTVAAALKLRLEILRMKPLQLEAVEYNLSPTKFESLYPLPPCYLPITSPSLSVRQHGGYRPLNLSLTPPTTRLSSRLPRSSLKFSSVVRITPAICSAAADRHPITCL